jgi:peptidoglycan/LPS O-acetylase OafA/YrhL
LKNNQHLAGLDAIRAIAILMVMTGHYYLEFLHPKELMAVVMMGLSTGGVIFFFLLSGYLISKSSEVTRPTAFLVRRLCKIYPAYWVSIAVIICLIMPSAAHPDVKRIVGNVLLMQDILKVDYFNNVFWSLLVEVKYYLLITLISALNLKRILCFLPYVLVLTNFILFQITGKTSALLLWMPLFFVGMEIYTSYTNSWGAKHVSRLLGVTIIATASLGFFYKYGANLAMFFLILGVMSLIIAHFYKTIPATLKFLATISYSLYLYHTAVGYPFGQWLVSNHFNTIFVIGITVSVSVLLAFISYRYIEIPGIRFGNMLNDYLYKVNLKRKNVSLAQFK